MGLLSDSTFPTHVSITSLDLKEGQNNDVTMNYDIIGNYDFTGSDTRLLVCVVYGCLGGRDSICWHSPQLPAAGDSRAG